MKTGSMDGAPWVQAVGLHRAGKMPAPQSALDVRLQSVVVQASCLHGAARMAAPKAWRATVRSSLAVSALATLLLLASLASSAEVVVTTVKDGCGLIDALRFGQRPALRATAGFHGATVTVAPAGDGTIASLFARSETATLHAKLDSVEGANPIVVRGAYTDGALRIPFTRTLTVKGQAVTAQEETDFSALPAAHVVAAHALRLPLVVCESEHDRLLAFGGANRAEMFRMDMNDERRKNQLLSDNRAFQPYWDIGGLTQTAAPAYRIWRANHADTMAYPVEAGEGTPGWADYSEPDWGLTVHTADTRALSIVIDARAGVLTVSPLPPEGMPQAGADLGRRAFAFTLALHEKSWPTTYPCELDYARYKKLLALLNPEGRYTHLDYLCGALGLMTKEGPKSPAELDALARRIVLRERVQPSTLLRLLYRGDGWRMSGIVRSVLGRTVPRNQPLHTWNTLAADVLDTLRQ